MNDQDLEKDRFYDELMAQIIVAGGNKIEPISMKTWSLEKICDLIWPNGIRLSVKRVEQEAK